MLHLLGKNYESLYQFISFVTVDEDSLDENLVTISDIPFIPDVYGKTPIHNSLETNNSKVTDCLLYCLKDAKFDHHSRYLVDLYPELVEKVPSTTAKYFDNRLCAVPWTKDIIRGRIDPLPDCDFVMAANPIWSPSFRSDMDDGILN